MKHQPTPFSQNNIRHIRHTPKMLEILAYPPPPYKKIPFCTLILKKYHKTVQLKGVTTPLQKKSSYPKTNPSQPPSKYIEIQNFDPPPTHTGPSSAFRKWYGHRTPLVCTECRRHKGGGARGTLTPLS